MAGRFDFTIYLEDEREQIKRSLTPGERAVFEYRANEASVIETAMKLSVCEKTVSRRSARIQKKIERMHARARRKTEQDEECGM